MMKYAAIATWKMAEEGIQTAVQILEQGGTASDAAVEGVSVTEDNPAYHSVGFGGRPDREGHVVLDGGYMDGDTLHFGAVGSIEGFRSPVKIARSLAERNCNNFLVGAGAERYGDENGFEKRDNLTEEAKEIYQKELSRRSLPDVYDEHDTVCFLTLDSQGRMAAATSTSGLFMKEPGRVGDTPVCGSGFYADSEIGAAAATGMGEEIMKGALSYAAVMYMRMGMRPMVAARKAVNDLDIKLRQRNGSAQAMSLIALSKDGEWGIGTNVEFTFVTADEKSSPMIWTAIPEGEEIRIQPYEKEQ